MRFAIDAGVALRLAEQGTALPSTHSLVAPTLLRSQVLAQLYAGVRRRELDRATADARLDHLRSLRIRLLGDRVLQRLAWKIAEQLDWPDTCAAEYVAVTQLQAEAFVTLDAKLARLLQALVPLASFEELTSGAPAAGSPPKQSSS